MSSKDWGRPADLLARWRRRRWRERWLLLEAALWLAVMRAGIRWFSFRAIAERLGLEQGTNADPPGPSQKETAQRIGWAVQRTAPQIPWETYCLVQGLAGARMLRRRHLPFTLYFGVARDDHGEFQAHAWLCCGDLILTGRKGHERFAVIATYR
jgi:hypothetical protein